MYERVTIGLGEWLSMTEEARCAYGPHVTIDLNDLGEYNDRAASVPYTCDAPLGEFEEYQGEADSRGVDGRGFTLTGGVYKELK